MIEFDPEVRAKIDAIKQTYRERLGASLAEIEAALAALGAGPDGTEFAEAARTLAALAHKLAGSAATFGFLATGDAARRLEAAADALIAEGAGALADRFEELSEIMADVLTAAAEETNPAG